MAQEVIEAPITGTVISIEVKPGDRLEEGDVILYIQSMKMENPILMPASGTIVDIKVEKDQVVETGTPLATIEY